MMYKELLVTVSFGCLSTLCWGMLYPEYVLVDASTATKANSDAPTAIIANRNSSAIAFHIPEINPLIYVMGIDVNKQDKNGSTVLHDAARCVSLARVSAYLTAGANPNIKDNDGATPLHLLMLAKDDRRWHDDTWYGDFAYREFQEDKVRIATLLLNRGADINAEHKKDGLMWAVWYTMGWGSTQLCSRNTPLHHALGNSQSTKCLIQLLLSRYPDLQRRNYAGKTAEQMIRQSEFYYLLR